MLKFQSKKGENMLHQPTLRVIKVLNLLANSPEKLSLSLISKQLNIPPSTLFPILQTLQNEHFILCDNANKSYDLDYKVLELAQKIKNENTALELIKKYMKNIRDLTQQTCQLGILKGGEVLYLEKFDASSDVQIKSFVGASYPAYATALGKALLEKKSKKELAQIYTQPFITMTQNTTKNIDDLYTKITQIKKDKIAIESGELNPQIECMAIGIEYKKEILAAISIAYPLFYSSKEFKEKNKAILLQAKDHIQKALKLYFPELKGI